MQNIKTKAAAFANVIFVILLAVLTVNKYSPQFLNADVLINSIISLDNITLFYWGQNRIINFLPLLASVFSDPALNLYFVLFTAALAHYALLFYFAKIAVAFSGIDNQEYTDTKVFLVISFIFIAITKQGDIFSIAIWHFEYSLPLLMIIWVFWGAVTEHPIFYRWLILSTPLIFVATGLNYSIVILSCALIVAYLFYAKKINRHIVAFGFISIFLLIFIVVADQYGNKIPYLKVNILQLPLAVTSVAVNLTGAFNVLIVALLALCFIIIRVICAFIRRDSVFSHSRLEIFALSSIAVFCFGWLILFSSLEWIEMNLFCYRYFTFLIYGFLIFTALQTVKVLRFDRYRTSWFIAGGSFILTIMMLWSSFTPLSDYGVFKNVNSLTPESHGLYAGDYWLVWPAVFRDMMAGKQSFGLTYRGEGNRENAKAFIDHQLAKEGHLSVICLNDKPTNCKKQISGFIGPGFIYQVVFRGNDVSEVILIKTPSDTLENNRGTLLTY